jgi:hypothetical protein
MEIHVFLRQLVSKISVSIGFPAQGGSINLRILLGKSKHFGENGSSKINFSLLS